MFDLNLMDKIGARPPPPAELVQAWNTFFGHKVSQKDGMNNLQAQHVMRTFKYLQRVDAEDELSVDALRNALAVTRTLPDGNRDTHVALARLLFWELLRRTDGAKFHHVGHANVKNFVTVLAESGHSNEARDIAVKYSATPPDAEGFASSKASSKENLRKTKSLLWKVVITGYAREENETELLKTGEMSEGFGCENFYHQVMATFYALRDDVPNTKKWYDVIAANAVPSPTTMSAMLKFSIRNNELDWCKMVFRDVLDRNPTKSTWDILFQWAAGALGKGVEDVERMIEVMTRHNSDDISIRPDAETINGLVELAMSSNDPYLAERYIALGMKYGIRPNAQTFLLQLNYRVSAGDLTGAQAAYDSLRSEEVVSNSDLPAINKYIRALCASKVNHYDRVVSICSDLDERNVRLEPDTVSAICMMYLSRSELDDVLDTLQANVFHYTLAERASILNTFVTYCLDRKNSTTNVWEAYNIFRHVFQETPVETRTQMMNEFFARKRSDMACHVFGHMRQHIRKEFRPVLDTYIDCFRGIARCNDKESLDMVHNMFKMDSSIEPNTKLYNSLMMAYTQCDESDRALDFWDDITNSREGPSYESLELVFKACQEQPFGDRTARDVWSKMRRMEIEVTREVFVAYIGALAGQGKMEEAEEMVESAEKDLGLKPDVLT